MNELNVWTDGSCKVHTNKRGGWAFVVLQMPEERILHVDSNYENNTTIAVMEMTAVLKSLELCFMIYTDHSIKIHTDSEFVVKAYNEWIPNWTKNNWKTSAGEDVKNRDLWERIIELTNLLDVEIVWVKAHAESRWNVYVDSLANLVAESTDPMELFTDEERCTQENDKGNRYRGRLQGVGK